MGFFVRVGLDQRKEQWIFLSQPKAKQIGSLYILERCPEFAASGATDLNLAREPPTIRNSSGQVLVGWFLLGDEAETGGCPQSLCSYRAEWTGRS
ncbi:hypothetical protein J6590_040147 [Homalodisca vitripennis]|nr:hypothetical protein J6590_040147 [Homalodisca vitripennis]